MKEVYINELTGEPYYVSPDYEPISTKKENSIEPKSWLVIGEVVLACSIGSTIGTIIGIMLCTLIS